MTITENVQNHVLIDADESSTYTRTGLQNVCVTVSAVTMFETRGYTSGIPYAGF